MPIPSPYRIETLSIYRDRDLRPRQIPRQRGDREKNKKIDLETGKSVFAEKGLLRGCLAGMVGGLG
jgi:hypothetical protein